MASATRATVLPAVAVALVLDGLRRGGGPVALSEIGLACALLATLVLGGADSGSGPRKREQRRRYGMTFTTPPNPIRPPVIFGASPSLLRVFMPTELPALARRLPEAQVPRPLRLLTRKVRDDWSAERTGMSVLLEHEVADVAAAVVVGIARAAQVPLLWVSARELVSSELAFPQRAMSGIVRFALRSGPCLVYVHDFDAIARPNAAYPSHYARRATHDVVSAMRTPDASRGDVMLLTSVSPETLDRSVVIDRFDVAIRLQLDPGPAVDGWPDPLSDVA